MTNSEAHFWQTLKPIEDGGFDEAAPRLAALVADASDARFHSAYGICMQKLGRWFESIRQFQTALALQPADCEADLRNMLAAACPEDGRKGRAITQWRIVAVIESIYSSRDVPIDEARQMLEKNAP